MTPNHEGRWRKQTWATNAHLAPSEPGGSGKGKAEFGCPKLPLHGEVKGTEVTGTLTPSSENQQRRDRLYRDYSW